MGPGVTADSATRELFRERRRRRKGGGWAWEGGGARRDGARELRNEEERRGVGKSRGGINVQVGQWANEMKGRSGERKAGRDRTNNGREVFQYVRGT